MQRRQRRDDAGLPAEGSKMPDDPAEIASKAWAIIATCSRSTQAGISLFRIAADEFASRTLELAADRLAGLTMRPGPQGIDDAAALARILEVRPRLGAMSVA